MGTPELRRIAEGISDGWILAADMPRAERARTLVLAEEARLGGGEAEALALAESRKLPVILDDKAARLVAERLGLQYLGTLGVLLQGLVAGRIERADFEDTVRDLTAVLWLSPEVVVAVLKRAREMEE